MDDTPANLVALRAILDDLGLALVEARSGEEALGLANEKEYAVIVLDVRLPGRDGFETAKLLREIPRSSGTPVIFLTSDEIDRAQLERGYELGAVDFFVKPLMPAAVRAKVRGFADLYLKNERARRESEQLKLLVHGTKDYAIFMLDPTGHIATWNAGAERLKGYAAHEIIGQHFSRFYPEDAIARGWPAHELEVAAAEGRFEDEGWRVRKDGSRFWANVVITALRDERGTLRGFSKITRDLTERKNAEEAARRLAAEQAARKAAEESQARLRASEEQLRQQREWLAVTLASIGDAVIATDTEGRVTFLNAVAERLTGWTAAEANGRPLAEVFPITDEHTGRGVESPVDKVLREGTVVGLANHAVLATRDGAVRPIDDSAAPIRDSAGAIVGVVLIFRDVSASRRADRQREARSAVTHALGVARTTEEGMSGVLTAVGEHLDLDAGLFWTVGDHGGESLACRNSWHPPDARAAAFVRESCGRLFRRGEGVPGRVWAGGEPAWIPDVTAEDNFPRRAAAQAAGLHTGFALPVRVGEQFHGVVEFFTRRVEAPDPGIQEMMGTVAGAIGQFLERRRAEEGLREQTDTAETLLSIGTHLGQERDLERLVQFATDESTRLTGAQFGAFFYNVIGERGEAYTLYTLSGVPREAFSRFPMPRNTALFGPTFRGEGVVRLADVTTDPRYGKSAPHHGMPAGHLPVKSYLAVPVTSRTGEVFGGLFFGHAVAGLFTDRHERLVVGVAGQAAVAIDNVRLLQQTRASEERFRQLADAMPQIVWTARPDGQIDYLNRRWTEFTGLPDTAGNDGWREILHPGDAGPAGERWAESVASGRPFEAEVRLLDHRAGSYRWNLIRTVPVRDASGAVGQWYGTSTDIHGQKRDEQTARFLADASTTLAVLVDFDSTLQKVASLAVPHFADWASVDVRDGDKLRRVAVAHVDPAKVELARDLHRRFPPDPDAPGGVWHVLKTGQAELVPEITDDLLVQSVTPPGLLGVIRELGLKSYIGVPLAVRGKTIGVVTFIVAESGHRYDEADLAVAKDLAARAAIAIENAQLYKELKEADRKKDEFLALLAHELRNPLAPLRNGLQVLRLAAPGGETLARAREMMERQLAQMVRLVDDLLDISRITRGKLELKQERVALGSVVHSAIETSRPLIEQAGHTLSVALPPAPVHLLADPVRLAQVFSNLLNNAAKYTEPGGRIVLTAEPDGAAVVVSVRDTGLGIPADALARVFEMFTQVDRTMERAQGGLGIGLTLVKRLVEMHGGTVEARSEGPGHGSEFVVRLPGVGGGEVGQEVAGPGAGAGAGRRILVVDDNVDAAESLGMMLELLGSRVRTAHDGLQAVEAAREFRPEVVLLDIGLPKLNGYDACRRIRSEPWSAGMVIVALTGWGQETDRRRSRDAGFDHHLVKPVDAADLTRLLSEQKR